MHLDTVFNNSTFGAIPYHKSLRTGLPVTYLSLKELEDGIMFWKTLSGK